MLPLSVSFMFITCLAEDGQLANQRPHFYREIALPITRINFRCTKIILEHMCADAVLADSMCAGLNTTDARLSTRRVIDCNLIAKLTCHVPEVEKQPESYALCS